MTWWATPLRATTAPSLSTARAFTEVVPISTPIVMAPRELLTNLTQESYVRHYAGPRSHAADQCGRSSVASLPSGNQQQPLPLDDMTKLVVAALAPRRLPGWGRRGGRGHHSGHGFE